MHFYTTCLTRIASVRGSSSIHS